LSVDVDCVRPRLVNGVIHESTENTDGDEIPDYDNLSDDDDEIQYSDRFGMHNAFLQFRGFQEYC